MNGILWIVGLLFLFGLWRFRSHKNKLEREFEKREQKKRDIIAAKAWWNELSDSAKASYIERYHTILENEERAAERAEIEAEIERAQRYEEAQRAAFIKNAERAAQRNQQQSWNTPRHQQSVTPRHQQSQPKPQQSRNKYTVQVKKPGHYTYENLTGGDSNMANAERRMNQHKQARSGSDNRSGNASEARYRIVDKDGKVQ
jgi:FtsZ-interacting cell division protein ZipA